MSLEIYKRIVIEKELKKLLEEGFSLEDVAVKLVDKYSPEDISYIIEACIIPIDEITKEIVNYDLCQTKTDKRSFIDNLCKKYCIDRKTIIDRMQNVKIMNSKDANADIEMLKGKRSVLEYDRKKMMDKSMDEEEKGMYYFGLGIVTIVSGFLFYPASPVLVGLIPIAYTVGLPTIRLSSLYKKEFKLIKEISDIDTEIKYLEDNLIEDNNNHNLELDNSDSYDSIIYCAECIDDSYDYNGEEIEGPTLVKRKQRYRH